MHCPGDSSVFSRVKSEFHNSLRSKVPFLLKTEQNMYFCMSTHVYKQVRKCTELFNRATCREEGKGSLFMCIQSDLSCQCSLYRTLVYKELEHLPILVSKEAPGTSPQRYRGMAFYHERDVMFIMRVYNDKYLNLCVCVCVYICSCSVMSDSM